MNTTTTTAAAAAAAAGGRRGRGAAGVEDGAAELEADEVLLEGIMRLRHLHLRRACRHALCLRVLERRRDLIERRHERRENGPVAGLIGDGERLGGSNGEAFRLHLRRQVHHTPRHLIAPLDVRGKRPLVHGRVAVEVAEVEEAGLSQLSHDVPRRLVPLDYPHQRHLLRAYHLETTRLWRGGEGCASRREGCSSRLIARERPTAAAAQPSEQTSRGRARAAKTRQVAPVALAPPRVWQPRESSSGSSRRARWVARRKRERQGRPRTEYTSMKRTDRPLARSISLSLHQSPTSTRTHARTFE